MKVGLCFVDAREHVRVCEDGPEIACCTRRLSLRRKANEARENQQIGIAAHSDQTIDVAVGLMQCFGMEERARRLSFGRVCVAPSMYCRGAMHRRHA